MLRILMYYFCLRCSSTALCMHCVACVTLRYVTINQFEKKETVCSWPKGRISYLSATAGVSLTGPSCPFADHRRTKGRFTMVIDASMR